MKTIDLLVQELPALGGFPEGAVEAGFLCSDDTLYFVNKEGNCPSEWRISMKYDVEDRWVEVTREQYEAALAAKNYGWIEWGGGECPVTRGTLVDVRYRDGKQLNALSANYGTLNPRDASFVFWCNYGCEKDIIAYRLHQPQKAEQAESDDEADLNERIGQGVAQVWDGEGKPTIGTKCEHHSGGQWEVVTIAGIHENLVTGFTDYWMVKEDGSSYTVGNPYRFRPVRSEADKKRDDAVTAMLSVFGSNAATGTTAALKAIYDAIAADEITGVKLED